MMNFRIKECRESLGMTQEELSKKSGVSRNLIAQLESGRITNTTTETLLKLAKAMDMTVEALFYAKSV